MITQTILVPGVPHTTTQNELLRLADTNGRDFVALLGPFPFNGRPAEVVAYNTEAEVEVVNGFVAAIGKQPAVMVRTGRGSSDGTHYLVWADKDSDLFFVESADDKHPVRIKTKRGPAVDLTTGQFAEVFLDGRVVRGEYFVPGTKGSPVTHQDERVKTFVNYVRSRSVAAGLFSQHLFDLGAFADGIPHNTPTAK